MRTFIPCKGAMTFLLAAAAVLAPAALAAQAAPAAAPQAEAAATEPGNWEFAAGVYAFLATINGKVNFPNDRGSTDFHVSLNDLLNHLKMDFMGAFDVHKGRWGVVADFIYVDVGGSKSQTQDFSVGSTTIPATAAVQLSLDEKITIWSAGPEYRVVSSPGLNMDVFVAVRELHAKTSLDYSSAPLELAGSKQSSATLFNGITGVKGRYGEKQGWFVPFSFDAGTGDSRLTLQGVAGTGYAWDNVQVLAVWRYLEWKGKLSNSLADLSLNGATDGVAWRC